MRERSIQRRQIVIWRKYGVNLSFVFAYSFDSEEKKDTRTKIVTRTLRGEAGEERGRGRRKGGGEGEEEEEEEEEGEEGGGVVRRAALNSTHKTPGRNHTGDDTLLPR